MLRNNGPLKGEDAEFLHTAFLPQSEVLSLEISHRRSLIVQRDHIHHHQPGLHLEDSRGFRLGLRARSGLHCVCLRTGHGLSSRRTLRSRITLLCRSILLCWTTNGESYQQNYEGNKVARSTVHICSCEGINLMV